MRHGSTRSGAPLRSARFMAHAVERYRGSVMQLALARTRNEADAQDVTQEVFIKLMRSGTVFRSEEHLRAWLLRAAHSSCTDLGRQAWRRHVDSREDMSTLADEGASERAVEELMDHPVWAAMEKLSDAKRCALHLRYVEGYSIEEAAGIMGCSIGAARTRLHRGRAHLAQTLDEETNAGEEMSASEKEGR
ncbi:MAG: RNA polymerase sigma factor [Coriobacteriaceae bacterium]|nr:RNA polymerase sigma factor [Coriobacteriaceae bacterium]